MTPTASPVVVTAEAQSKGNGTLHDRARIFPFSGTFQRQFRLAYD